MLWIEKKHLSKTLYNIIYAKQGVLILKRTMLNWLGLLGIVSFLSYVAAVVFSPLAYPGYNWMAQAVSDLSAVTAPSKMLWNQLASLYGVCGIVCIMSVCVFIQGKLSKILRIGIYLFAAMNWISFVGYSMFPLADRGMNGVSFQDKMHIVVTILVVIFSVISLAVIMIGGYRKNTYRSLAIWASLALLFMFLGSVGVGIVPGEYFGIPERFSVFAATGFNTVLGVYLFNGFDKSSQ